MHFPTLCLVFAALARAQDFPITTPTSNFSSSLTSISSSLSTADLSSSIETSATETSTGSLPLQTEIDVENNSHGELPPIELTPQESVNSVGFEIEMYAQHLQSPMTLRDSISDSEVLPIVIPSCPNTDAIKETKRWLSSSINNLNERSIFGSRPKRPVFRKCTPNNLVIDIKFHYVANGVFLVFPTTIASRIQKQVDFLNLILDPQGITLNYLADADVVYGPEFTEYGFYGKDLTRASKLRTQQNDKFMRETRVGGPDVFNVWIVNSMTDLEDSAFYPTGHAYFPEWRKFDHDGCVLLLGALRTNDDALALTNPKRRGSTLVHEFGHWMGLTHMFGDSDCGSDDGIADTARYSGASPGLYECLQTRCGLPSETPQRVQNWMSYSRCKGFKADNSVDMRAFTPNQRAAMFARFLMFRRSEQYSGTFCANSKLRRRQEAGEGDEAKALAMADLLLQNCTVAIQDVYEQESIPLPQAQFARISSEASSLSATPKPRNTDPGALLPQTAVLGSATAEAGGAAEETGTATGTSASATKTGAAGRVEGRVVGAAAVVLVTVIVLAV